MADLLAYGEDIIGFPGGEATAKVKLMTKLWENPYPTASFAAQTVTLSSDDWDFLLILSRASGTDARIINAIINMDGGYLNLAAAGSQGTVNRLRAIYVTDKTHIVFDTALYSVGTTGAVSANSSLIPIAIYGIKLEQEIRIFWS